MKQAIKQLRGEAAEAGDQAQVEICDRALEGDDEALAECESVLRDAAGQDDAWYHVGIGDTSMDTWSEYQGLTSAWAACIELAWAKAIAEGLDPADIDRWEDPGDAIGGACPRGNSGSTWPVIYKG